MRAQETLQRRWSRRAMFSPLCTALAIEDRGLVLGRGTVLARMTHGLPSLDLDTDADRLIALLTIAYQRSPPHDVLKHVAAASTYWRHGDKAMAHLRLATSPLPPLTLSDADYRLFLAEVALEDDLSPEHLLRELGFDGDLRKYDPEEPRVPAGSGDDSGQWSKGGGVESKLSCLPWARRQHEVSSAHSWIR